MTMKRKNAEDNLARAVDWKIFECQSLLIAEDANEEDIQQGILWLQPRHYLEIVEERSNDRRCGFPQCKNSLNTVQNQQFRINYKDKEIYKIENSSLFCSDECLQKSFFLQRSLSDSSPYSRSVVSSIDFSNQTDNEISDVLNILEHNNGATDKDNILYPAEVIEGTSRHPSVEADGKVAITFSQGIPTRIVHTSMDNSTSTLTASDAKVLLVNLPEVESIVAHRDTTEAQKKSSVTSSSEPSLADIFAQMKAVQERSAQRMNSSSGKEVGSENTRVYPVRAGALHEQQWVDPVQSSSTISQTSEKTVSWSPSVEKPSSTENVVTKKKKNQKPVPIMSSLGAVMERAAPRPMSESAMMLKQEIVTEQLQQQKQQQQVVEVQYASDNELRGVSDAFSIEDFMPDFKHMRVAPATTVKNLSYSPFQWEEKPVESGNDENADYIGSDDGSESGHSEDGSETSLFLTVWSAMDDLFCYCSSILLDEQSGWSGNSIARESSQHGAESSSQQQETTRLPVASESQQVQSAINSLLERGLRNAERLLDVFKLLQPIGQLTQYHGVKNKILAAINRRLVQCPSLRSTGWTLIGILLVDAIVRKKCFSETESEGIISFWESKVETMSAGVLGGGHIAGSTLRMDDLKILRSFFDNL